MASKEQKQPKQTVAQANMMWVYDQLTRLTTYMADTGEAIVALPAHDSQTVNHEAADSTAVQRWLQGRFHDETTRFLPRKDIEDAVNTFIGTVSCSETHRKRYIRVAPDTDRSIWLDLGGNAVHIQPAGWTVDQAPEHIGFHRPHGFQSITPEPIRGGDINELRRFIHTGDERTFRLMVGWLLGALLPWGDYAILMVGGEPNSGKSTVTRYLRNIIDPGMGDESRLHSERDLVVQASNTWITTFGNVTHLSGDLSDVLCQLSTGLGSVERKYYTNNEPLNLRAHGPVILNGIHDFIRRGDLVSRTIRIRLPAVEGKDAVDRSVLDAEFADARPRLLGALLDIAAKGLARLPEIEATPHRHPRMGDLRNFVTACEPALGWPDGTWDAIVRQAEVKAHQAALEEVTATDALLGFLADCRDGQWNGKTAKLHVELKEWASAHGYQVFGLTNDWPASPVALSKRISLAAGSLRAIGVRVEFYTGGPKNARVRCIRLVDNRAEGDVAA